MKFHIRCTAFILAFIFIFASFLSKIYPEKKLSSNINVSILRRKHEKTTELLQEHNVHSLLDFKTKPQNISVGNVNRILDEKTILLFNLPRYMAFATRKERVHKKCEYPNCKFTRDRRKLWTADAILFFVGIRDERLGKDPPINRESRNPNQTWIFTSVEPPEHYYNTDYRSVSWQSTMNWSVLYRLDADIPNPYGTLITKSEQENKDYIAVYNMKTRNALWLVSHCRSAGLRREYVADMVKYGFDVDIFGGCGSDGEILSSDMLEEIIPTYKFYLAFENSLCNDYITEKYFQNYNFDWIVVVRGGADYHRLLPAKTFISTSDFSNVSSLVHYLTNLGNDKERYIEYLRSKDRYTSIRWPVKSLCEICRRLNNISKYRKTYNNIAHYLHNEQCMIPTDI